MTPSPTSSDLRGVSAPSEGVAWITGTRGACLVTRDSGRTWRTVPVPGAEALDFRDVEAFGPAEAVVMSAGEGAASRIYATSDGGAHWSLSLQNPDAKGFFDAIAFRDRRQGLALGDPVDGRFAIFATEDGGRVWARLGPGGIPPSLASEGAFAASGTCLAFDRSGRAWFGTGGAGRARVFRSEDGGRSWTVAETPIPAATPSAGIFSLAFADALHGVAVGGDYRKASGPAAIARTDDGGITWTAVAAPPAFDRFLSAVAVVPGTDPPIFVAAGTEISGWSSDGGRTWTAGQGGWNAIAFAGPADGWAVGPAGRVVRFDPRDATWRGLVRATPSAGGRKDP
ncbi:MAG: oxidoreductase [Acidobacteriota bacterium]|nr:oxidoreductase [Acidobacteriota bacterium]